MSLLRPISTLLCALVALCYAYQLLYLFLPRLLRPRRRERCRPAGRYAVLIAARNEEAVLPYLLRSLNAQDYPRDRFTVFVCADNCSDGTAAVARAAGAVVYQRRDADRVGKGYVLDHLLRSIRSDWGEDAFDAYLVFDADNLLAPDYLRQMDRLYREGYAAFCGCRAGKNVADSWVSMGSSLWYLHDSFHLNRSRMLLGSSCAVTGTGFGFTRELIDALGGWHFFTLTEDVEFNACCAAAGVRIAYCPEAVLFDEQPVSFRQSWRQRTRWVQGGIQVSFRWGLPLLRGLGLGGRRSYACFETLTLSLWGYGVSALATALAFTGVCLTQPWPGVALWLGRALLGMYLTLLPVGLLTLWDARALLPSSARLRLIAGLSFPLFMMSYIPLALTAVFRPFRWPPIEHRAAVGLDALR